MGKALRLLIVDDSEDDALLVVQELRHAGYETSWRRVENPTGLRQALPDEPWDLVVSDHQIGRFAGLEALAIVRQHDDRLPFLFVSGTVGEDVAVAAVKAGASDYILKGLLRRLAPAVERELQEAASRREAGAAAEEEALSLEESVAQRI